MVKWEDKVWIGSKLVSITAVKRWIKEKLTESPFVSPEEWEKQWSFSVFSIREILSPEELDSIVISKGYLINKQDLRKWLLVKLRAKGVVIADVLEEWPIERTDLFSLVAELVLQSGIETIRTKQGNILPLESVQERIVEMLDESEESLTIDDIAIELDISNDELETVMERIPKVLVKRTSVLVPKGEIEYELKSLLVKNSNPPTYSGVNPIFFATNHEIESSTIINLLSQMPIDTVVGVDDRVVLFDPLLSEFSKILRKESKVNINDFLEERRIMADTKLSIIHKITDAIIVTESGNVILKDWILSEIIRRAEKKGLVDISALAKELDMPADKVTELLEDALPKDIRLVINETSKRPEALYHKKWLIDIKGKLEVEGRLPIKDTAKALGVTLKLLENVLTRATGGLFDRDFEVFRLRTTADPKPLSTGSGGSVEIKRGGEWSGSEFKFKVKVWNTSENVITDVAVQIHSYPRDSMKLEGKDRKEIPKIDPGEFRSPEFLLLPTQDCVKGNIIATVTYMDHKGKVETHTTEKFQIKAVCDLLVPEHLTTEEFQIKTEHLPENTQQLTVDGFDDSELTARVKEVLELNNFSVINTLREEKRDGASYSTLGWSRGKYTKKGVAVKVIVHSEDETQATRIDIHVIGEDPDMLGPVQDELGSKLNPWNCPYCRARLDFETAAQIRENRLAECKNCGHVLSMNKPE
ncbi:MAG: hypothetical protein JW779_10330 [Candidatus Thorarchaeota archaeon]|nr:hypothetical protein [Candidatus Thorarchaeota archaeon]